MTVTKRTIWIKSPGFLLLTLAIFPAVYAENLDETDWQKHYQLSSRYGVCVAEQLSDLSRIAFNSVQPTKAKNRLYELKTKVAEQDSFFQRNAVEREKPNKLFKRAKQHSELARKIKQSINWQKEPDWVKPTLTHLQICYLKYHRDLRNEGYSDQLETPVGWEEGVKEAVVAGVKEAVIYNVARSYGASGGASKDAAEVASFLDKRGDKVKRKPWRALPVFFDQRSLMPKIGASFGTKNLRALSGTTLHLRGLKNSCECLGKAMAEPVWQKYCKSLKSEIFLSSLERHEVMLEIVLAQASKTSPSLVTGDKKAKLKLSESPELATHSLLMNNLRREDKAILKEAETDVEGVVMKYLDSGEEAALFCALDAMSSGRRF